MKKIILILCFILMGTSTSFSGEGMVTLKSPYSAKKTIDRLENILKKKGMTIFTRIDHSKGAKKAGLELPSTIVLIFGNPKVGTPVMQCQQGAAIDFPQKALAWEDENGNVWLSYNNPEYLVRRHHIKNCEEQINKIKKALNMFANSAIKK